MSDVLQTAVKYRNRLRAELGRLEEFLRLAEDLSKEPDPEARIAATRAGLGGQKQDHRADASKPEAGQKAEAQAAGAMRPGQGGATAVA